MKYVKLYVNYGHVNAQYVYYNDQGVSIKKRFSHKTEAVIIFSIL